MHLWARVVWGLHLLPAAVPPVTTMGVLPALLLRWQGQSLAASGWVGWLVGGLTLLGGGALIGWAVWELFRAGRSSPATYEPASELVATGPFRWSRNPIFVGALTVVAGEALLFTAPILVVYGVGLAGFFHGYVVYCEEPRLRADLGAAYDAYCDRVPRWL